MPDEVDVWPLLEEALAGGKIAALPRFDPRGNDYVACRVQNSGRNCARAIRHPRAEGRLP